MIKIISKMRNRMKFPQLNKEYLQKKIIATIILVDEGEYFFHKIRNRTIPEQKVSTLKAFSPTL